MSDYQKAINALKKVLKEETPYATNVHVKTTDYMSGGGGRIIDVTVYAKLDWSFEKWCNETNRLREIVEKTLADHSKGWHDLSVHVKFRDPETNRLYRAQQREKAEAPGEPARQMDTDKLKLIDHAVLITVGAHDETHQVVLILEEPVNMIKTFEPDIARRVAQQLIFFAEMCEMQKTVDTAKPSAPTFFDVSD